MSESSLLKDQNTVSNDKIGDSGTKNLNKRKEGLFFYLEEDGKNELNEVNKIISPIDTKEEAKKSEGNKTSRGVKPK